LCAAAAILSWGSASLANDTAAVSQAAQAQTTVALVCKPLDMNPIMATKSQMEAAPNGEQMWQDLMNDFTLKGGH
jgi:hypothetical protein